MLLAGLLLLAGVAEAVEVNSAQGLANAKGFKGNVTLSGNTVTLTRDVTLSEALTIIDGSIILDLGGKTITNKKGFEIKGKTAEIQLKNGTIKNEEKISVIVSEGNLLLQDGISIQSSYFSLFSRFTSKAILIQGGSVTMNGGEIKTESSTDETIGVQITSGSFSMNKGRIEALSTVGNAYKATGIKIEGGKDNVQLKGGTITGDNNTYDSDYAISSNQPLSSICVRGYGVYKDEVLQSMTSTEAKNTVKIKPISYNFNCDLNGGTITSGTQPDLTYTVESPDITLPTLSKQYYEFLGWRYDLSDVERVEPTVTIKQGTSTGDRSFTAQFKPIEYPIIYERNGGQKDSDNPEKYTVETVATFAPPKKPFYKFEGWYESSDFSGNPMNGLDKNFYGNPLKLYAKWSPEPFEVNFYKGKTIYEEYKGKYSRDIENGIKELPKPEEPDRYFTGWKDKEENGNLITEVEAGTTSLSLYASWNWIEFIVEYDPQGGEMSEATKTYTSNNVPEWLAGESVWWKEKEDDEYTYAFKGWYLDKECSGQEITAFPKDKNAMGTISSDGTKVTIKLYAKWEKADYDILFLPRGGSAVKSGDYSLITGIEEGEMPETTRRGWKFLGWFDKADGGTKYTSVVPQTGENKQKMTFYAHWEPNKYLLTYETYDGDLPADAPKTYTVAEVVTLPVPKKAHYDFAGWFDQPEGGTKYDKLYNEIDDKTFYARWIPKTYHLSFETNGGSEIKGSFPFTYGKPIEIDKRTYRTNYDFEGWFVDEGLTKPYDKNTSGSIGGDLTLYAKWGPKRYKIHYDMFHGEPLPDDTYTTEESKQLPTNAVRSGFTFAGWYADDMLTVGPVTKIEKGESGDKTFYATWKPGYSVRFTQPENGKIEVKRRSDLLVSGDKVGEGVEITITATPTDAKYALKALSIGGKIYTSSPQTIKMPANDVYISAIFEDARTVASAPEIITDPENTDNMMTGTVVKVTLKKTDESTTLYYSISDGPKRPYEGPFEMTSDAKQLITLKAFAVKEGYKDGVTVRDMGFGVKKLLVTFDLPAGITAVNPLGGEVVSAIASGGAFEFSLEVDKNYFQSLDSMTVLANDSVLTANANGVYRVEGASKDVKITVKGLKNVTYTVTLTQPTKGGHIHFTEDGSDDPLTLPCSKQISVTAVPDLNYKFGGWKNGSQANPGIFTITSDTTLEAVFVPDAKYFTITLPVLEGVTVKPLSNYSTEVMQGGKFHFYLRFAEGYHGEHPVVKANGVELTANEEGVYSLYRIAQNYSISVEGVMKDGVKLKLADHVLAVDIATATDAMKAWLYPESMISLLATAPDGQYFVKWNDGNSDNPRVVTVREASGTLPLFQPILEGSGKKDYAKIQLPNVVGAGVGVQVDVHTVEVGGKMPFKVVLLPGYSQSEVKVTANGKLLEEGLSMRAASKSRTLVYSLANVEKEVKIEISGLKLDTYNVGVEQAEGGKVSVSPSGRVECGKQVVFTATPDAGNMFVKWSDGNTLNPYPISVDGDMNLKAVFMRSDMAVANEEIIPSVARIYVRSGRLYVEAEASDLYIWNMDGVLLKRIFVPDGCSVHLLPAGFYLVKVGDGMPVKIAIR